MAKFVLSLYDLLCVITIPLFLIILPAITTYFAVLWEWRIYSRDRNKKIRRVLPPLFGLLALAASLFLGAIAAFIILSPDPTVHRANIERSLKNFFDSEPSNVPLEDLVEGTLPLPEMPSPAAPPFVWRSAGEAPRNPLPFITQHGFSKVEGASLESYTREMSSAEFKELFGFEYSTFPAMPNSLPRCPGIEIADYSGRGGDWAVKVEHRIGEEPVQLKVTFFRERISVAEREERNRWLREPPLDEQFRWRSPKVAPWNPLPFITENGFQQEADAPAGHYTRELTRDEFKDLFGFDYSPGPHAKMRSYDRPFSSESNGEWHVMFHPRGESWGEHASTLLVTFVKEGEE